MIAYDDGATPLDYDELKGLLPTHITTLGELNFLEMENISQAIIWSDNVKATDIINVEFICKLHKKMFSNVWKWAGKFRKSQKNIGIPYIQIEVELQTLCDDAQAWTGYNTYSPDEFAARFHHRLVFIHPFPNGNGRHARLMADLILEKLFATKVFSWGGESLANHKKTRKEYIKALKMADEHDYSLLLEFVRS
jgi:Fic-DOC domain mobile mystery protein B